MSSKARLFVGVKVSMATVDALTEVSRKLRTAADEGGVRLRMVAPATYHVTLKFLGWTRPEAISAIRDALADALAGQRRFRFRVRALGAFPRPSAARVVWAGIDGDEGRLAALAGIVDERLAPLGYAAERRPFHAHVTLARLREVAPVDSLLLPYSEQIFSETEVAAVTLYESIMKSSGSEYVVRGEQALDRAS